MGSPKDSETERQLVQRCLEHDRAAREQLVCDYQGDLLRGIRRHLHRAGLSEDDAEDIAEQFWESLLAHDFHILRAFNAQRGGLRGYIQRQGWQQVTKWQKRRRPEEIYLRPAALNALPDPMADIWPTGVVLDEFLATLSPQLRDYCDHLLGKPSSFHPQEHPPVYVRVLRHRLSSKLEEFLKRLVRPLGPENEKCRYLINDRVRQSRA